MNIHDTKAPRPKGDMLSMIFQRQKELHFKYKKIERINKVGLGLLKENKPFSIDSMLCQEICKNYAWRITEELTESTEVIATSLFLEDKELFHAQEEAMDALHFMIELLIITGQRAEDMVPKDLNQDSLVYCFSLYPRVIMSNYRNYAYDTIEYLGKAMNCLKQKPWKQTQVFTDTGRFHYNLQATFDHLIKYCTSLNMTAESCYDLYFRKSEVNKFRIKSNY